MMQLMFIISLFVGGQAWAQTVESLMDDLELREIQQALNSKDLYKIKNYYQDLRVFSAACERQMRQLWVPQACYELRARVPVTSPLAKFIYSEAQLQKVCLIGSEKLNADQFDLDSLPMGPCRSAVEHKLDINRYKLGL